MDSLEKSPLHALSATVAGRTFDATTSNLRTEHRLCPGHDTPRPDDVVGVAGEQGLAVGGPGQADALGLAALLADVLELGLELVDLALLLEVEDDDAAGGGSAEPVPVGGEDESVDLVVGVERVQVLALVKIPQHRGTVLTAGSAEGSIGGDGDGVDVTGVADVVGLELAARELPNLLIFPLSSAYMCLHRGIYTTIGRVKKTILGGRDQCRVNVGLIACESKL